MKLKSTYKDAYNKKKVREFLFSYFLDRQLDKIVGLAGPDINDYVRFCKSRGFNEFEIFENNFPTLIHQMQNIRTRSKIAIKYTDILNADASRGNVLFDLDFCVTARYMKEHIKKFKDNFIMTFSRRIKDVETIRTFFKCRGENIITEQEFMSPIKHKLFTTNGGEYIYVNYRDTSNMCCIAKIK